METYTPLRALHARVADEVIFVRVSRLWYHRGGTDRGPIKQIHMVLLDSQGDASHGIVPDGFVHTFIHILHETNVYELNVMGIICGISDIKIFGIPRTRDNLVNRHVYLRDLDGHEIKIVLWGDCALRFHGDTVRTFGQTESAIAIFVGTTVPEYDGTMCLAGGASCSWYINEDIVDINIFRTSPLLTFQPITHTPQRHVLSLRTQVGENWPTKQISLLVVFNLFENKESNFRCTVRITRISSREQWWYSTCQFCNQMAKPNSYAHANPHSYIGTYHLCGSKQGEIV